MLKAHPVRSRSHKRPARVDWFGTARYVNKTGESEAANLSAVGTRDVIVLERASKSLLIDNDNFKEPLGTFVNVIKTQPYSPKLSPTKKGPRFDPAQTWLRP